MERLLWVCFGGALGTGVRYLVNVWASERFGVEFPYGTLIVNVLGCFLIAVVGSATSTALELSPTLRAALATGFLGGLTTYSSFNQEVFVMARGGALGASLAYLGLMLVAGAAAALLGWVAAERLLGA